MIILKLTRKLFAFFRSFVFSVPFWRRLTCDNSLPTLLRNLLTIRTQIRFTLCPMDCQNFDFLNFLIYRFPIIVSLLLRTFPIRASLPVKLTLNFSDRLPKIILFQNFDQKREQNF